MRRRRWALIAPAAVALVGCSSLPGPATLRPPPLPRDDAAVFHSLLPGEPPPALGSPESAWQALAEPPAMVAAAGDGLTLTSVPGRRAWASPRLPMAPLRDPVPGQVEELTWRAAVRLDAGARFFIVCELRFAGEPGALLVQATPFDVQVTHDADRPEGGTSDSISRLVGDGNAHFWRLRLDGAGTQLRLNGTAVWSFGGHRSLTRVAFGETRTDALHAGTMTLRDVVYVRRPA